MTFKKLSQNRCNFHETYILSICNWFNRNKCNGSLDKLSVLWQNIYETTFWFTFKTDGKLNLDNINQNFRKFCKMHKYRNAYFLILTIKISVTYDRVPTDFLVIFYKFSKIFSSWVFKLPEIICSEPYAKIIASHSFHWPPPTPGIWARSQHYIFTGIL